MKRALVIANGDPPRKQLLQSLVRECNVVICADGGANTAFKFKIQPDAIVGDMDSIHAEALVKFRRVHTFEDRGDESTDLEKALSWAIEHKYDHIVVVGASGKRLDHTIGNLGVLPKFYPDAVIRIVDDVGEATYVGRELAFDAKRGDVVSLLPLSRCEGITTQGLRYALDDEALELGVREGTSNVVSDSPVSIKVRKGHLLLYKLFARP